MVPLSMSLSDPWSGFQGRRIIEIKYVKTTRYRSTPTLRNGNW